MDVAVGPREWYVVVGPMAEGKGKGAPVTEVKLRSGASFASPSAGTVAIGAEVRVDSVHQASNGKMRSRICEGKDGGVTGWCSAQMLRWPRT